MLAKVCSQKLGRVRFANAFLAIGPQGGLNRCGLGVERHRLSNKEIITIKAGPSQIVRV
jgi:hypothetical protein